MIYLDHNATTIIHKDVRNLVYDIMDMALNPSSIHSNGRLAKGLIEKARAQILESLLLPYNSKEYSAIFTSTGTEANNLILSNYSDGEIFTSATEHVSIFNHTKYSPNMRIVEVCNDGIINIEHLQKLLSESTINKKLVSVIFANNETGVIQPIEEIAKIATKFGAQMHSDASQAFGKIEVDMSKLNVDFLTISAHKFGGPLGAASLITKTKYPLKPMIIGGGQERSIRSGTENVPAICGFGLATKIALEELTMRYNRMKLLQSRLEDGLSRTLPQVRIIAQNSQRLPNTSSLIISKLDAQACLIALDMKNIAVSSGSACSSGKVGHSHVLKAMGISEKESKSSIRISLSHYNLESDIDFFIRALNEIEN